MSIADTYNKMSIADTYNKMSIADTYNKMSIADTYNKMSTCLFSVFRKGDAGREDKKPQDNAHAMNLSEMAREAEGLHCGRILPGCDWA